MATSRDMAEGRAREVAAPLIEALSEALHVDRVGVWLVASGGADLQCLDVYDRIAGVHRVEPPIPFVGSANYLAAHAGERAVAADDALRDPRTCGFHDYLVEAGITSMLDAAIRVCGEIVGFVCSEHIGPPRKWNELDVAIAGQASDQIALALSNCRRLADASALRASDLRYRLFIANSNAGICRFEFHPPVPLDLPRPEIVRLVYERSVVVECNDALARQRGYPDAQSVIGLRMPAVRNPQDPHNARMDLAIVRARFNVADAPEAVPGKDGRVREILSNLQGTVVDGCLTELWAVSRDVTSLRHAERAEHQARLRFENLVNTIDGIVWTADPATGNYTFVSGQAQRMLGWPAEQWTRSFDSWIDLVHPDDRNWVRAAREDAAARGEPDEIEYRMRTASGRQLWVRDLIGAAMDRGRVSELHGVIVDISRSKQLEEDLRALAAQGIAVREEERSRIAREIHDELGQQLTVFKFDLAAMRAAVERESSHREGILDRVSEMTSNLDTTIRTMRRISTQLRPSVLDHFGIAAALEFHAREFTQRTGIRCECVKLDETPVDPDLATTVFRIAQEALTNAARHSGASEVKIRLWVEGATLMLEVRDNGRGLPAGRLAERRSLGILGMKERARGAGGRVALTSQPGGGTAVTAWFPLDKESPQ